MRKFAVALLVLVALSAAAGHRARKPFWASGPVSRFDRWNGGFRVWIGDVRDPFFVPRSFNRRYPIRVGAALRIGGYYNPRGWYDYDRSLDVPTLAAGTLRGVVESVDASRGRFMIRNDATDNLVHIVTTDPAVDELRAGDRVEVAGDWTRSGLFATERVDVLK